MQTIFHKSGFEDNWNFLKAQFYFSRLMEISKVNCNIHVNFFLYNLILHAYYRKLKNIDKKKKHS